MTRIRRPEDVRRWAANYRARDPEGHRAKKRAWYRDNKASHRRTAHKARLKVQYGLSVSAYDEMVRQQEGRCAICTSDFVSSKDAHIDHDHETGLVRGILCSKCNLSLGLFGDAIPVLEAAINYLQTASEK